MSGNMTNAHLSDNDDQLQTLWYFTKSGGERFIRWWCKCPPKTENHEWEMNEKEVLLSSKPHTIDSYSSVSSAIAIIAILLLTILLIYVFVIGRDIICDCLRRWTPRKFVLGFPNALAYIDGTLLKTDSTQKAFMSTQLLESPTRLRRS